MQTGADGRAGRGDFSGASGATGSSAALEVVYPDAGAQVYAPTDLAARKGQVVLQAAHLDPEVLLMWHLHGHYLGQTQRYHQQAVDLAPGWHQPTVVDSAGQRAVRRFEVLGTP